MTRRTSVLALTLAALLSPGFAQEPGARPRAMKTDAQWAKILTPEQFMVTRRKATEPAFSGKYLTNHAKGTYECVCCGAELFSSQAKFDSGTGWPSFWRPIDPKTIATAPDLHEAEPRVEVMCRDCGAHLGHVFNDGPPPTGLRFCLNSTALKFVRDTPSAPPRRAKPKAKAKAKPRAPDAPAPKPSDQPSGSSTTAAELMQ